MFIGPVGPVEVFFYWPEAVFGNFYWPGAIGSPLASSPEDIVVPGTRKSVRMRVQNDAKNLNITETQAHVYSSESTQ